ncbi:hypothetical protein ACHAO1_002076 [Botrytis cinerea]
MYAPSSSVMTTLRHFSCYLLIAMSFGSALISSVYGSELNTSNASSCSCFCNTVILNNHTSSTFLTTTVSIGANSFTRSELSIITAAETPDSSLAPCTKTTISSVPTGLSKSENSSTLSSSSQLTISPVHNSSTTETQATSLRELSTSTSKSASSSPTLDIKSSSFVSSASPSTSDSPGSSKASVSSISQSSNSTSITISPTSISTPICDSGSNKFMSQDDMMNQIGSFCKEAAVQSTQDKDSGSIFRTYHQGGRNKVDLAID